MVCLWLPDGHSGFAADVGAIPTLLLRSIDTRKFVTCWKNSKLHGILIYSHPSLPNSWVELKPMALQLKAVDTSNLAATRDKIGLKLQKIHPPRNVTV